jgi:hypothetical protein
MLQIDFVLLLLEFTEVLEFRFILRSLDRGIIELLPMFMLLFDLDKFRLDLFFLERWIVILWPFWY